MYLVCSSCVNCAVTVDMFMTEPETTKLKKPMAQIAATAEVSAVLPPFPSLIIQCVCMCVCVGMVVCQWDEGTRRAGQRCARLCANISLQMLTLTIAHPFRNIAARNRKRWDRKPRSGATAIVCLSALTD